jgi:hypothetical protein
MKFLETAIEAVGMEGFLNLVLVLAVEDAHRGKPDLEMNLYAAERLGFGSVDWSVAWYLGTLTRVWRSLMTDA